VGLVTGGVRLVGFKSDTVDSAAAGIQLTDSDDAVGHKGGSDNSKAVIRYATAQPRISQFVSFPTRANRTAVIRWLIFSSGEQVPMKTRTGREELGQ
jgi:hypothetical protein